VIQSRALCCCPQARDSSAPPAADLADPSCADPSSTDLARRVRHLYLCQELSTYRIAAIVGIGRQRIGRMLNQAGVAVKPRGAGRPRSPSADLAALTETMEHLYVRHRLTSAEISALTRVPERTVRDRLRARGVAMRTRGRHNREDRRTVAVSDLAALYVRAGLSAAQAGRLLGTSGHVVLRAAHDHGIPVRVGGPPPAGGPTQIELVRALYADPLIQQTLDRHGMRRVPAGGPISQRFPGPIRVGPELAKELYESCGLGLHHIELLSGQPAETVRAALRARGVRLRSPGGRSPFMRRWRAGP
jgi:hypothetical protein